MTCSSAAARQAAFHRTTGLRLKGNAGARQKRALGDSLRQAEESISAAEKLAESRSAWRIEGTLREFPKFPPVNVWFDYPIHRIDMSGVLKDIQLDAPAQPLAAEFQQEKVRQGAQGRA